MTAVQGLRLLLGFVLVILATQPSWARDRLQPYLKLGVGYLSVESTDMVSAENREDALPGGWSELRQSETTTDLSGEGVFYELGVGIPLDQALTLEISALWAPETTLDGDLTEDGYYRVFDDLGILQDAGNYQISGTSEANLETAALMVDLCFDVMPMIDRRSKGKLLLRAGVGYAYHRLDDRTMTGADWVALGEGDEHDSLAWRVGVSLVWEESRGSFWSLDYYYLNLGEATAGKTYLLDGEKGEFGGHPTFDVRAQAVAISYRMSF